MKDQNVIARGLSMLTHLSFLLLIPILVGLMLGLAVDSWIGCSPWGAIIGTVVGVAAAFRNLYVWSVKEIGRANQSERVQQALRENGKLTDETDQPEADDTL